MSDELLAAADSWQGDPPHMNFSVNDIAAIQGLIARLAARVRELEAERDSLRCPNCDKLRLELGDQRQRAERAEAERDALSRNDEMLTRLVGSIGAERDGKQLTIDALTALVSDTQRKRDDARSENERLRQQQAAQAHVIPMLHEQRDALRALLRECESRGINDIDSDLLMRLDAALAGEKP